MKETVEIKIGEKVMSVDASALFSHLVKGRTAMERIAIDRAKTGHDIEAEVYRERIEKCRPVADALADYVYELLKK